MWLTLLPSSRPTDDLHHNHKSHWVKYPCIVSQRCYASWWMPWTLNFLSVESPRSINWIPFCFKQCACGPNCNYALRLQTLFDLWISRVLNGLMAQSDRQNCRPHKVFRNPKTEWKRYHLTDFGEVPLWNIECYVYVCIHIIYIYILYCMYIYILLYYCMRVSIYIIYIYIYYRSIHKWIKS